MGFMTLLARKINSDKNQPQLRAPTYERNVSSKSPVRLRTDNSQKGYVDLLDAQSEFKPTDFHTRVKATGTRDYGEDVADRNIGVNGCDLDSQPVQAFYAVRPKSAYRISMVDRRRPFSSWNRSAKFNESDEDSAYGPHITKGSSFNSALSYKPINASHRPVLDHGNSPPRLSAASPEKNRALQRPSYASSASTYSTPSLADIEASLQSQRLLNGKVNGRSRPVSAWDANGLVSGWESEQDEAEGGPRFGVNNQPILSPQPTSFRLSASLASSAFTASNKRPATAHSSHSVRRSQQPALESHNTAPDLSNLPHHLKEQARNFKEDWHDDLINRDSAPSPFIKTSRSPSMNRESVREIYSPANSNTTPRPQSQSGELDDQTPRTNSIRHWSMTSTAPTMSSSSLATYGRPQSRHTTSTSIDLSTTGPPSTGDAAGKGQGQNLDASQSQPLVALQSPLFNIDDYVSSDDDSFIASQAKRSEEDLLFSGGYGKMGTQLPGLEDAFAVPAPIALVRSPRLIALKHNEDFLRAYGEPHQMAGKHDLRQRPSDESLHSNHGQRRRHSSGASDTGLRKTHSREELSPAASPAKRVETKRMAAILGSSTTNHTHHGNGPLGSHSHMYNPRPKPHLGHGNNVGEQVIEEERFEKVDVATAIRLRKDAKSRKRASTISIVSQTGGRGRVKAVSVESHKMTANVQEANVKAVRQKAVPTTATGEDSDAALDIANVPELVVDALEYHENAIDSDDE
ncbi:hypothetical protein HMPREF1624_05995 [Sporothrix schenckii ATCC 58251]|uniref:Uncharacterized protein n=2 Tax=Sporothrix schenckii TaxID=29908 RepID=U7PSV0_SPOS1|nr:hypothetical protein HMPREF1624_05995 [Sporothrix schenckii ATCC 58251]